MYTIEVEPFVEIYYTKHDTQQRYPKHAKRVAIVLPHALPYDMKEILKRELRAMDGWYNLKYNEGKWSLRNDRLVIDRAIDILNDTYDTSQLIAYASTLSKDDSPFPRATSTATVRKGAVYLNWPYIEDITLRDKVRNIVKGVPNRKWHPDTKEWSIPLNQSAFLHARLEKHYPPLANAIAKLEDVNTYVEKHTQRIKMSDASSIDNTTDMEEKLSKIFPKGKKLYPFQYVGVRFVELTNGRCLIGDDMGIGKTIQTLAYIGLHPETYPVLVVCPANVKYNWLKEAQDWLPNISSGVVKDGKSEIPDTDIVIINYDLMRKKEDELMEIGFNLCVFDESHYLKNRKAQRTIASLELGIKSEYVICLSGTAITNRPEEFFTTLNLICPADFPSFMRFAKRYCAAYHNGWGWDYSGSSNSEELHLITRDFTIRRLKKEVMSELPDKIRQFIPVHPHNKDLTTYQRIQRAYLADYYAQVDSGHMEPAFVLTMLTELRHHCGLLKVKEAAKWVQEYYAQTSKPIVVYAHHLDVIEALDSELHLPTAKITGKTSSIKRMEIIDAFQEGKIPILICSTVAAKEGITLTAADTVVFVEREWVAAWEEQAEDRVNRIGQDSENVHAVYLTVSGTIDERFDRIVEEKREVVSSILDGGDIETRKGITTALLESMIDDELLPESAREYL